MDGITDKLTINVGGELFTTTRSTLELSPFFNALLKGKTGEVFVDRDPDGFRHILRKLRDNCYAIPREWQYELEFYGLVDEKKEEEKARDSDIIAPLAVNDLETYRMYIIHCLEHNVPLKHVNVVVKIEATLRSHTLSTFDIPRYIGTLGCVLYDFNNGPIKKGTMLVRGHEHFIAHKGMHFPTDIDLYSAPYSPVRVEMEGDLEVLHILVRYPLGKLNPAECEDHENNVRLNGGRLSSIYKVPPWYSKKQGMSCAHNFNWNNNFTTIMSRQ